MSDVSIKEAVALLARVVDWGYDRTHIADIFGDDLARGIVVFLSLNSTQWLVENNDYWETVDEPVPEIILAKMRETPALAGLVQWIDENSNGNW